MAREGIINRNSRRTFLPPALTVRTRAKRKQRRPASGSASTRKLNRGVCWFANEQDPREHGSFVSTSNHSAKTLSCKCTGGFPVDADMVVSTDEISTSFARRAEWTQNGGPGHTGYGAGCSHPPRLLIPGAALTRPPGGTSKARSHQEPSHCKDRVGIIPSAGARYRIGSPHTRGTGRAIPDVCARRSQEAGA